MAVKAIKRWTAYRNWEQLDVVLNIEQVCAILRISRPTAIKLMTQGEIPARKVGLQWRISRDALRRYLEGDPDGGEVQALCSTG